MTFYRFLRTREPAALRYALAFFLVAAASLVAFLWTLTFRWQLATLNLSIYAFACLQLFRELHGLWADYVEEKELTHEQH